MARRISPAIVLSAALATAAAAMGAPAAPPAPPGTQPNAAATQTMPLEGGPAVNAHVSTPFDRFRAAYRTAAKNLPASLREARGDAYFVAHVEAIAALKSAEAKEFAGRLAAILRAHDIKLSPELEKLAASAPAAPAATPPGTPAATAPATKVTFIESPEENIQFMAILSDFTEPDPPPDKPMYDTKDELQRHIPVLNDLLEAMALHAPSLTARIMAVIQLSSSESIMNTGLEEDEDMALTWVAPARIARAWDALFDYALDGSRGTLDIAASSIMDEFDDETLAMYCIAHGLSAAHPGKDVLTGPLAHLVEMAAKANGQIKSKEDAQTLDDFITQVKDVGGQLEERTQGFIERPGVQGALESFITAIGKKDQEAAVKCLTPAAAKVMPPPAELLERMFAKSDLFADKPEMSEPAIFFVAAPEKGEDDNAPRHVTFYLRAKAKGGALRYSGHEALMTKDGDHWRIAGILFVLEPEKDKNP